MSRAARIAAMVTIIGILPWMNPAEFGGLLAQESPDQKKSSKTPADEPKASAVPQTPVPAKDDKASAKTTDSPVKIDEFIFQEAPFDSCHASTIEQTRDKTLIAAWFGGPEEGDKEVGIWVSRRVGQRWSHPEEVANGIQYLSPDGSKKRFPCWNPVLIQPTEGPLMLFYKVGPSPSQWWGMLTRSGNSGETWSFPNRLPQGILGPIKNKPVEVGRCKLLCGSSTEHDGWRVHFEITPDHGRTWTRTKPANSGEKIAAIQPSILVHPGHRLQALGRSKQGSLWTCWSEDGGLSWGPMTLLDVPNPNSGTDAVTLNNGRHVLVYNHSKTARTPLNVAISSDGVHWRMVHTLEDEPGEYSYPAVIQSDDGLLHITYTWKRKRIKHVALDPAKL